MKLLFLLFFCNLSFSLHSQNNLCSGTPRILVFDTTSNLSETPEVILTVPKGFKILGGGARINPERENPGSLMTENYPLSLTQWTAKCKSHKWHNKSTITAYVIAIEDPNDCWDVIIRNNPGANAEFPYAEVQLDSGYTMTGGGGRISYFGQGNLLTSSYPQSKHTWVVTGKQHIEYSTGYAAAYVIGLKPSAGNTKHIYNAIISERSSISLIPTVSKKSEDGYILTGGGLKANFNKAGVLITKSFPDFESGYWHGSSKAHGDEDYATIDVYAIGLLIK